MFPNIPAASSNYLFFICCFLTVEMLVDTQVLVSLLFNLQFCVLRCELLQHYWNGLTSKSVFFSLSSFSSSFSFSLLFSKIYYVLIATFKTHILSWNTTHFLLKLWASIVFTFLTYFPSLRNWRSNCRTYVIFFVSFMKYHCLSIAYIMNPSQS